VIGGLAGITAGFLFVGIGYLAGVDAVRGNQAFVTIGIASGYDALLAPFVFMIVAFSLPEPIERVSAWSRN